MNAIECSNTLDMTYLTLFLIGKETKIQVLRAEKLVELTVRPTEARAA